MVVKLECSADWEGSRPASESISVSVGHHRACASLSSASVLPVDSIVTDASTRGVDSHPLNSSSVTDGSDGNNLFPTGEEALGWSDGRRAEVTVLLVLLLNDSDWAIGEFDFSLDEGGSKDESQEKRDERLHTAR